MTLPAKTAPRRSYNLRSVDNALALLEVFDHSVTEMSVTELGLALGLAKSTVSRLLLTLSVRGYVMQNPVSGKYAPGLKLFELGSVAVARLTPRETARPFLEALMRTTGETVHLGVLDGDAVVYIDKIESAQPLSMYSKIGRRAPIHATSLGKAVLAFQPLAEIQAALAGASPLTRYTERTIVEPARFLAELEAVRAQGYAVDDEEFALGLRCLAVPVRDFSRRVVASVGIGGAAVRIGVVEHARLLAEVLETAHAISKRLGFLPPPPEIGPGGPPEGKRRDSPPVGQKGSRA